MSDPANDGYECCGKEMTKLFALGAVHGATAFLCDECLKWRHALRPNDLRRPAVVTKMEAFTRELFKARLTSGSH